MRRRELMGMGLGGILGLAGCVSAPSSGRATDPPSTPTGASDDDQSQPVPQTDLTRSLPERDAIAAVTDPVFGDDWQGLSFEVPSRTTGLTTIQPRLFDADPVIGVERAGAARAYPLRVLNWHEIVNDRFDGPLLVSYCPLCRSGIVARRTVRGSPATFGVSEYLWRGNLVMYDDATESLWSQIGTRAIRGPLVGTELELVPAAITTWSDWRRMHPDSKVLLPPPRSDTVNGRDAARNYNVNPYAEYESSDAVPGAGTQDSKFHPKTLVLGIAHGSHSAAYPFEAIREAGVINDRVGELPVVVTVTAADELVGYVRRVDGEVLRFEVADAEHLRAGGSRWRTATGMAVDGPHDGVQLRRSNEQPPMFWFAWQRFNPDSRVYDG